MLKSIARIQKDLRQGNFVNEASVSQGIVLPLLAELGWAVYDVGTVSPEYSVQGLRVDFALCSPPGKPVIFVEVKQVGKGEDTEHQLFEYAFHEGVQLAVLTTGQEWNFFLPSGRGTYLERRVYKLDLLEREPEESMRRLKRYLDYEGVRSEKAIQNANDDYKSISNRRESKRVLPEAWQKLLEERDELLIELLVEKAESLCGFRPENELVDSFLSEQLRPSKVSSDKHQWPRGVQVPSVRPANTGVSSGMVSRRNGLGFKFRGQVYEARNHREVLLGVFRLLSKEDASFLDRFASRSLTGSARRPKLARSPQALFPGNEGLSLDSSNWKELENTAGWFIDLNQSASGIHKTIETACEVAGVSFGVDLVIL